MKTNYGSNLENLQCGSTVGLLIDEDSRLHLYINGADQGIAATDLPLYVYAIIDLYGQCEQISIIGFTIETVNSNCANNSTVIERASSEAEDFENSREKADLECHEKENIVPEIGANVTLNIPIESTASLNLVDNMPHSSSNNNSNHNSHVMASSIHSDSNNSDSYSDINNDQQLEHLKQKHHHHNNDDRCNRRNDDNVDNQDIENSRQVNHNDLENCSHLNNITRNECTNVEINNATNINIKNGSAMSTSNMSNLNTAINSTNANNAINESIASNSQNNQVNQDNHREQINGTQNNIQFSNIQNNMIGSQDLQLNLNGHYQIFNNSFTNSVNSNHQNIHSQNVLHNAPLVASLPSTPIGSFVSVSKKCEYLKACTRLKKSLVLPDEFFSLDEILCYCHSCYKIDGDSVICKKGEPLAEFAVPIGWTRFPLKQSINANQIPQLTTDKWHVAFYGTRLDAVR